jgi:hypothetical protein
VAVAAGYSLSVYVPGRAVRAPSHRVSTEAPVPLQLVTAAAGQSRVTVTVQAVDPVRPAVIRGPVAAPYPTEAGATAGETSVGPDPMAAFTLARISVRAAYPLSPGHAVLPTSRWPETTFFVTAVPAGYLEVPPPEEVSRAVPYGSRPQRASFQANSALTALVVAAGTAVVPKVPIIATPKVPKLKPPACAPITVEPTPP